MRLAVPPADESAPLARRNPVAKLAAALILGVALFITLDPVAPAVILAGELAVVPLFGLRYRDVARRSWAALIAATALAVTHVIFAEPRTGALLVPLGPFDLTTDVALVSGGLALRLLAIALPGIVALTTTDPTRLADALTQNLRASPRFAVGALAAFRLLPLLADDWRMLRLARRARGVSPGRGPLARGRFFASTLFGLLVGAIRRGTRLAVAMDARGFDSGLRRGIARPIRVDAADRALIVGAVLLGAAGLLVSALLGTFHPSLR